MVHVDDILGGSGSHRSSGLWRRSGDSKQNHREDDVRYRIRITNWKKKSYSRIPSPAHLTQIYNSCAQILL